MPCMTSCSSSSSAQELQAKKTCRQEAHYREIIDQAGDGSCQQGANAGKEGCAEQVFCSLLCSISEGELS